jgi:hypothetical protein
MLIFFTKPVWKPWIQVAASFYWPALLLPDSTIREIYERKLE